MKNKKSYNFILFMQGVKNEELTNFMLCEEIPPMIPLLTI